MVKVSVAVPFSRDDLRLVIAAAAPLLAHLRSVQFDASGALVVDGAAEPNIRLVAGQHPNAGARYMFAPASTSEPASPPGQLEVTAHDQQHLAVRCTARDLVCTAELAPSLDPAQVQVSFDAEDTTAPDPKAAKEGGASGDDQVSGTCQLELRHRDAAGETLDGHLELRHRRFTARIQLACPLDSTSEAVAAVVIRLRLRGALRLLNPLVSGFGRRFIRREVLQAAQGFAAGLSDAVAPNGVRASSGQDLADRWWHVIAADAALPRGQRRRTQ